MQQFIECAQNQRDISLCQGFNEALRQCKLANGKKCLNKINNNKNLVLKIISKNWVFEALFRELYCAYDIIAIAMATFKVVPKTSVV